MPDDTNSAPTTTPTSTGNGATPSSPTTSVAPTAAGATPAAQNLDDIKYQAGEGIPDWLVGKSMREGATLNAQMYRQLVTAPPAPAAPTAPSFLGTPARSGAPAAEEFLHDPAGATQRYLGYIRDTQLNPAFEQRDNAIGAQAVAIAEMQHKDEFRRWGPEIMEVINQTPSAQRTPGNVSLLVDMVRARHLNELINEGADQKIKNLVESGTLRSQSGEGGTGAPAFSRVDFDKLPPTYRNVLQRMGVTAEGVDDMLRIAYPNLPLSKARDKWMEKAVKGDVISDGPTSWHYEEDEVSSHGR